MYEHLSGELQLRYHPNPVLKEKSEPIEAYEYGEDLFNLGKQMVETMMRSKGVGLAGPQVGLLKRIFVMDSSYGPVIVCNPELELGTDLVYGDEGCLSIPGVRGQVARSRELLMHFHTPMGAPASIKLAELDARIVQHETDHLDGILFFERMPRNPRRRIERDYQLQGQTFSV